MRWSLAFVFLFAGKAKSQDLKAFLGTIAFLRWLPTWSHNLLAHLIILIEFFVGASLLLGLFTEVSFMVAILLLVPFTGFILVNWIRGTIFDCNCFGPYLRERIGGRAVLRNTIFITMSLGGLKFYDGYLSLDSIWMHRAVNHVYPLEHFMLFALMVTGIIISILFARQVIQNFNQLEMK